MYLYFSFNKGKKLNRKYLVHLEFKLWYCVVVTVCKANELNEN